MMTTLVMAYLASVLALLATAIGILRMHCESFGCMGLGVAWFAWAVAYAVVLGLGWFARCRAVADSGFAQVCRAGWWIQMAVGVFLAGLWIARRWI